jgi:NAD(P)-dependent dehydrogenase (short-subunit alcohol dehydrogenase family)
MGQINLVHAALPHIADKGSFTLISGVLTDECMHGGTIGTTVNHLAEGFVKSAAVELPRGVRINCVSPTVLAESPDFQRYMPGFPPVPAAEVALAYLRAISNPITGRILKLHLSIIRRTKNALRRRWRKSGTRGGPDAWAIPVPAASEPVGLSVWRRHSSPLRGSRSACRAARPGAGPAEGWPPAD